MRYHTLFTKIIANFLVALLLFQLGGQAAFALGEGPSQPEAMQFEPVDTTDMVTLSTGDFVYTLPVIDVPGPEGNYELALSYHSGIGVNQEATWVGLGWSLNPGAVNRHLAGLPDDYDGDFVQSHYQASTKRGWGASVSLGIGPVGLNLSYQSHGGFGGSISLQSGGPISVGISMGDQGPSASVGLSFGSKNSTVSPQIGLSVGTQGISAGVSARIGKQDQWHTNQSLVGFGLSSKNNGASFNASVGGLSSTTTSAGNGVFTSTGFSVPIPLPGIYSISLGFSWWKWKLNKTFNEESYGYVYQHDYHQSSSSMEIKKFERQLSDTYSPLMFSSQDMYTVNAQGLYGTFMPFAREPYQIKDESGDRDKGQLNHDFHEHSYGTNDLLNGGIVFRFLDETGSNLITQDDVDDGFPDDHLKIFVGTDDRSQGARRIHFTLDDTTGELTGFTIVDTEGKTYEFAQPVFNSFNFSYMRNGSIKSYTELEGRYASNWLLTAIKGPDYVDRGLLGQCDSSDWGYWIRLTYKKESGQQLWRSPYEGYQIGDGDAENESCAMGLREVVYLESVASATHTALFRTSIAGDRQGAHDISDLVVYKRRSYKHGSKWAHEFPGDFSTLISAAHTDSILVKIVEREGTTKRNRFLRKGDITWSFDQQTQITTIIDNTSAWNATTYIKRAILRLYNIVPEQNPIARQLNRIDLFNNKDLTTGVKSTVFSYADYDGLCRSTPNSSRYSRTKLTLKSIRFLGKNGASKMPDYKFNYIANHAFHPDDWDAWGSFRYGWIGQNDRGPDKHTTPQDKGRADAAKAWSLEKIVTPTGGSIQIEYESDDYHYVNGDKFVDLSKSEPHEVVINPSQHTITGSVPTTTLEGQNIFLVNSSVHHDFMIQSSSQLSGIRYKHTLEFKGDWSDHFSQDLTSGQRFLAVLYSDGTGPHWTYLTGDSLESITFDNLTYCTRMTLKPSLSVGHFETVDTAIYCPQGVYSINVVPVTGVNGDVISFPSEYFFRLTYPVTCTAYFPTSRTFGGGIRVKSILTSDGSAVYKTSYSYVQEDGVSSGVTASLPPAHGNEKRISDGFYYGGEDYCDAWLDGYRSYRRPSPAVIYSRVEVANVDANDMPLNGKTVYEFYTAKDFKYEIETVNNELLSINDKSGIYGKPKSITYHTWTGEHYKPTKKDEMIYSFSDDLLLSDGQGYGEILRDDGTEVSERRQSLGLIQEKFAIHRETPALTSDYYVSKCYQNVFLVETSSKEYTYASDESSVPYDSITRTNRDFLWDALTGQSLAQATYNSEGHGQIKRSTPAYWKYSGMKTKNMLSQVTQQTTYQTRIDFVNGYSGLAAYAFNPDDIILSSVETWSNQWVTEGLGVDSLWRKDDTYTYDKQIDRAGGDPFNDFTAWNEHGTTYPSVTSASPWKMTSNITRYDRYSHPIEEVGVDQTYTAALYGYDRALPIAITSNSSYGSHSDGWPRGFSYCGFEAISGGSFDGGWGHTEEYSTEEAFTGQASAKIGTGGGGSQYGPTLDFAIQDGLANNTSYIISCWVKTTSPSFQIVANKNNSANAVTKSTADAIAQVGDWKLIQFEYPHISGWSASDFLRVFPENNNSLPAYVDDIRVYPKEASMSTFAYDPLTWKVTSITDANNVSTYYEYDDMGRLIAVWDQDKYLRKAHSYQYGRLRYFEPKLSVYGEGNSSILRAGDTTYFHIGPTVYPENGRFAKAYYYFGDGHTLPPTLPDINGGSFLGYHAYEEAGHYTVTIQLVYYEGSQPKQYTFETEVDIGVAPPPPPDE